VFAGSHAKLTGVKVIAGDYNLKELGAAVDKAVLVGDIVKEWIKHARGRTTVCFATTVEHSMHITQLFREAGIPCEHLDGTTPDDQREAILGRLADGTTQIVSNVGVLTEGWDLPRTSAVILGRPTKSRGLWRQMVGRALRPATEFGKVDCLILDHAGCTHEHGFITDPDERSLAGGVERPDGKSRQYECPHCHATLGSWPAWCPSCGESLRDQSAEQCELRFNDTTELVEVDPQAFSEAQTEKRREFFRDEAAKALRFGWKPISVGIRFKAKFGNFPRPSDMEGTGFRFWWERNPETGKNEARLDYEEAA